jgi:hypothetical protein
VVVWRVGRTGLLPGNPVHIIITTIPAQASLVKGWKYRAADDNTRVYKSYFSSLHLQSRLPATN